MCATGGDQGAQPLGGRINWCLYAQVTTTTRGHDLALQICRDDTGPGNIDFNTSREADLEVTDANGQSVWRWSRDHSSTNSPHTLTAEASNCYTWIAAWTDVNASGARLHAGQYTLTATSAGTQFAQLPSDSLSFQIR